MFTTSFDTTSTAAPVRRDVRRLLLERRRALLCEIQNRMRDAREESSSHDHHALDPRESVDADPEDDVAFALIQLKAETLARVNVAVRHLDEGIYGRCIDCDEEIAAPRLVALPFAVRCRACEEVREGEQRDARLRIQRSPALHTARD